MTEFTLSLKSATQADIDREMIRHLQAQGYHISAPNETWETTKAFCARVGIRVGHFRRAFDHRHAPHVLTHRGPTGRVIEILSNSAFDQFCRRNKKHG